jgi:hypothetical protein
MRYQITGKFMAPELLHLPHAEWLKMVNTKLVPTLQILTGPNPHGEVLAGGYVAGSRDLVMMVDLKPANTHLAVRGFLSSLPIFDFYDWQVMPLDSFQEALQAYEQT